MQWMARRRKFRTIRNETACIRPASLFDPLSARIAEHPEFELGMFAGSTCVPHDPRSP
jgi:oxaloacetate decarboxylase